MPDSLPPMPPPDDPIDHVWHVIRGDHLIAMLQQAIDEDDAGMVYLEHYANTAEDGDHG